MNKYYPYPDPATTAKELRSHKAATGECPKDCTQCWLYRAAADGSALYCLADYAADLLEKR